VRLQRAGANPAQPKQENGAPTTGAPLALPPARYILNFTPMV
jgi:hypothetical protein